MYHIYPLCMLLRCRSKNDGVWVIVSEFCLLIEKEEVALSGVCFGGLDLDV